MSCNQIAAEVGRSSDTVSRVAHSIGHRFGQPNAAHAREVASEYGAERRARTMARFHQRAEEILERMEVEVLVFNFGGRHNTYEEHLLEQPPVETVRQMMHAARDAMRTVIEIDRHEQPQR